MVGGEFKPKRNRFFDGKQIKVGSSYQKKKITKLIISENFAREKKEILNFVIFQ